MEDFRQDGLEAGRGRPERNRGHESPVTESDRASYDSGYEEGLLYRRRVAEDIDRELGW